MNLKHATDDYVYLPNDQRLAAEQQTLDDMYEALSARPPEMAVVWRCARHQASKMLIPKNKFFSQVKACTPSLDE